MTQLVQMLIALSFFATFTATAQQDDTPQEQPPGQALIEGQWTLPGIQSTLGESSSTTINISQYAGRWHVSFTYTYRRSFNAETQVSHSESYSARVENGVLIYRTDEATFAYTFQISEERLVMPAIVEREPGQWYYYANESYDPEQDNLAELEPIISLAHDHREQPTGEAQFVAGEPCEGWYVVHAETANPNKPEDQPETYISLLSTERRERIVERARMVFDPTYGLYYRRYQHDGRMTHYDYPVETYRSAEEGQ